MKRQIEVGDVVERSGKKVEVIAITEEGMYVVRFIQDKNASLSRCYLYSYDDLDIPEPAYTVEAIFEVNVYDILGQLIDKQVVDRYPSDKMFIEIIRGFDGVFATVQKINRMSIK